MVSSHGPKEPHGRFSEVCVYRAVTVTVTANSRVRLLCNFLKSCTLHCPTINANQPRSQSTSQPNIPLNNTTLSSRSLAIGLALSRLPPFKESRVAASPSSTPLSEAGLVAYGFATYYRSLVFRRRCSRVETLGGNVYEKQALWQRGDRGGVRRGHRNSEGLGGLLGKGSHDASESSCISRFTQTILALSGGRTSKASVRDTRHNATRRDVLQGQEIVQPTTVEQESFLTWKV